MENLGNFPFGEAVERLSQKDRTPKKYFVIGSYASAVHTAWYDLNEKVITKSLAVANEPEILWTGNSFEAMTIINRLNCPPEAGSLCDPGKWMNGGVGRLFNMDILKPLNIFRSDVWLALLIPFTIANKGQRKAMNRYNRICEQFKLPPAKLHPSNIKSELIDEERISELLKELEECKPDVIITLGDLPLHHFIRRFDETKFNLTAFKYYGSLHEVEINSRHYKLLPLYHPKAGENLGSYTEKWMKVHKDWIKYQASGLKI